MVEIIVSEDEIRRMQREVYQQATTLVGTGNGNLVAESCPFKNKRNCYSIYVSNPNNTPEIGYVFVGDGVNNQRTTVYRINVAANGAQHIYLGSPKYNVLTVKPSGTSAAVTSDDIYVAVTTNPLDFTFIFWDEE